VAGKPCAGYSICRSADAPFLLLLRDWDGLTEYEIKRASMLAEKAMRFYRRPVRRRCAADKSR
jgi:hypothetical protein